MRMWGFGLWQENCQNPFYLWWYIVKVKHSEFVNWSRLYFILSTFWENFVHSNCFKWIFSGQNVVDSFYLLEPNRLCWAWKKKIGFGSFTHFPHQSPFSDCFGIATVYFIESLEVLSLSSGIFFVRACMLRLTSFYWRQKTSVPHLMWRNLI